MTIEANLPRSAAYVQTDLTQKKGGASSSPFFCFLWIVPMVTSSRELFRR
jgi:hypothetical protein